MSDIPKRYEPFLSPDGLRKVTQLMKSHFDSYPHKDLLYNDSKGLQYNGSMYNFGSEILFETSKLKMNKPPVRNLTYNKDTTFYFDIKYADSIDTYDQQNMLVCNIRKDRLIQSHEYRLRFNHIDDYIVIRSTNSSAGNVGGIAKSIMKKELYYKTLAFPILIETFQDENDETVTIEHELRIKDGKTFPTFYFYSNDLTEGLIDEIIDVVEPGYTYKALITVPLTDEMFNLPVIWFTTKSFEYLPEINLTNNIDANGHPLLTFGTDGNGVSRLYPNCYENNFPPYEEVTNYEWYLKVESKDDFSFLPSTDPGDHNRNYQIPIKSITLLYNESENGPTTPTVQIKIEIPDDIIVYLDNSDTGYEFSEWIFRRRFSSDYDWDAITYNNPNYAFHLYDGEPLILSFTGNHTPGYILNPGFRIKFRNEYLYKWESDLVKSVSGMHIDSTDERSNNGVIEKHGVSHKMGDFDGLPEYYKTQLDEKIHKSHVEVYSIRDHNNKHTQLPMDKQTAGIIIDSAVPQNQLPSFILRDINIHYNQIVSNLYETIGTIVSEKNVLSSIVYVDNEINEFSDRDVRGMKKYKQFIYHGNNYFSLDFVSLDPKLEYGRSYVLSNDDTAYRNNDEDPFRKPARTLARLCDIPTSIIHLTNIPDYSPSILVDWNSNDSLPYVRTFCNFELKDQERLWNDYDLFIKNGNNVIFESDRDISNILDGTFNEYKYKTNLNQTISLNFNDGGTADLSIVQAGRGYAVNDKVKFNIGGRYFECNITSVVGSVPRSIELFGYDHIPDVNISNLGSRESIYNTVAENSEGGTGLTIKISVHEDVWNDALPKYSEEYKAGLYLLKYDEYNHVWLWTYDNEENVWNRYTQITGPNIIPNPYDINDSAKRRLVETYITNLLKNNRKVTYETLTTTPDSYINIDKESERVSIPKSHIGMEDISDELIAININNQNSYMILKPDPDSELSILDTYIRYPYTTQDSKVGKYHSSILPRFNTLNLKTFFNDANRLMYSINKDKLKSQPDVAYYCPTADTIDTTTNISTDFYALTDSRLLTYNDIIPNILSKQQNLYLATDNIYRYNEYDMLDFESKVALFSDMTRDALITYIRTTYGDDSKPLAYESTNPWSKQELADYCLMVNPVTYERGPLRRVAQKYEMVAQEVENDDGTTTIVPAGGEQPTGMFKSLSSDVRDLRYKSTKENVEYDILFVFTVMKNPDLVTLRHFHIYDENNVDISKHSLLIYDGKKYLFDEMKDNWIQIV